MQVRDFFQQHKCTEVHVPLLQLGANVDHGIDIIQTDIDAYLCSSPEHYLKRLLCAGAADCFAIQPCFRKHEHGHKHRQEFYMLEWYRLGWTLEQLIEEVCTLIEGICGKKERQFISYHDAFVAFCQCDPDSASVKELQAASQCDFDDRDALLDACMVNCIEPGFNPQQLTVLHSYPSTQAAQAQCFTDESGREVAKRFEMYCGGLELANGYHELTDANELRRRMHNDNQHNYQLDDKYFAALDHGLPDCCGVALGLDRLFMLSQDLDNIQKSQAFANN